MREVLFSLLILCWILALSGFFVCFIIHTDCRSYPAHHASPLHVKASVRSFVILQGKGDHVGALIFNTCVSSQEFEGAEIFGVVEGGDILEERLRSARETAKRPVGGFCLDGFQAGSMDQALRTQLINVVTKELPEDKPRSALSKHTLVGE